MRTKEILRRSLGASLLTSVLATAMGGCGPYPDLKVFVNGIPGDAKQLAVILWKDNMGDTTAK